MGVEVREKIVINLIQDLATPHNNVLISQFRDRQNVEIRLWYALEEDLSRYQWRTRISSSEVPVNFYGNYFNPNFLAYCLSHLNEKFVVVGWANINTKLLHLLFFILRRPFNHWTDMPNPRAQRAGIKPIVLRWLAYRLLWCSRCKVFGVGSATVACFRKWGFSDARLVNLPIFVSVDDDFATYAAKRETLFVKYGVSKGDFLVSGGSRLIYEKGYDVMVRAVALLPESVRSVTKVIIVGSGNELANLQCLVTSLDLDSCVIFEKWLDIDDFKALIASSDVFVHPARFDAYGGTILGMSLGVPVIGSTGAGAAVDRIISGENGFLYAPEDAQALSDIILRLYCDPLLRQRLGREARDTALRWPPSRGAEILVENVI